LTRTALFNDASRVLFIPTIFTQSRHRFYSETYPRLGPTVLYNLIRSFTLESSVLCWTITEIRHPLFDDTSGPAWQPVTITTYHGRV
jgi:hypothetical protein